MFKKKSTDEFKHVNKSVLIKRILFLKITPEKDNINITSIQYLNLFNSKLDVLKTNKQKKKLILG